ncbi:malonate--CoA ligase ACSF3, mitochondrial isoform X1 [Rhagoletis pomonella]|uniref:malonate--CoA ligase ACSF3, mitochondrial isoform X1 n=1 Tax=Rhagoletis pomonella TaxID=28610 RepID=UPI001780327D|nr:malonate--CoA ligase ACSF3, mitochondrial isoform X1 [Rhagoletis pomonella]
MLTILILKSKRIWWSRLALLLCHFLEWTIHKKLVKLRLLFETEEKQGDVVPIFKKCLFHAERIAIKDSNNEFSYQQLYKGSKKLSIQISNLCGSGSSSNVAVFCKNDALLPLTQWGCWMSGQVFLPLLYELSNETLTYILRDSNTKLIICAIEYETKAKMLAELFDIPLIIMDLNFMPEHINSPHFLEKMLLVAGDNVFVEGTLNNDFYYHSDALLVYNTDNVKKPKGCMITHKNLQSRIKVATQAWNFKPHDYILNCLPAHYSAISVHSVMCLLSVGGKVGFYNDIDCNNIWNRMLDVNVPKKERPNVFTALPSFYTKVIDTYIKIFSKNTRMAEFIKNFCENNFRLMISGPQPLAMNIYHYWNIITGHKLLPYYETPETGTILRYSHFPNSQSCKEPQDMVGLPMPHTKMRIVNCEEEIIFTSTEPNFENPATVNTSERMRCTAVPESLVGELQVAGPTVVKGYLNQRNTEETCFYKDFFKTGIIVQFERGVFRLLGHNDNDIIRIAGQTFSSCDIETLLHTHPKIIDIAVVGVPHTLWKEKMYALCVLEEGVTLDLKNIQAFCAMWIPSHMCPDELRIVPFINRNSAGKIDKRELIRLHFL